jgi:CHAD domain-containing protein
LGDTLAAVDGTAAVVDRHRARVSVRRLRVGWELFAGLYPAGELAQMQKQLRRLGRALGTVRALDVNAELLGALDRRPAPAVRAALAVLADERAHQLRELAVVQRAARTGRLVDRLERLLDRPRRRLTSARLLRQVREEVDDLRRKLRRRLAQYEKKGSGRAFHRLRIAVKRYRYAVLAGGTAFPGPNRQREKALAEVQDLMGACHDLEVLRDWLRGQVPTGGREVEQLVDIFNQKHKQSLKACRRHLARETSWRKKIKLELEHD